MPGDATHPDPEVETARSFAMLLVPEDLPGPGWQVVEERSWPTGGLDAESGKSRRAIAAGCVTAWRKLGHQQPSDVVWVEVVPYASGEDAGQSLAQIPRFFVVASQPDETVVDGHVVTDRAVPGVTQTWLYEKASTGPGGDVVSRYVAGVVGSALVIACFVGDRERWSWDEVIALATAQTARARRALDADRNP